MRIQHHLFASIAAVAAVLHLFACGIPEEEHHRILDEMGEHLESKIQGKIFKVDTILANAYEVAHMFAGNVWETRKKILEVMSELFPARRDLSTERFDAILYSVPDASPYAVYSFMNPLLTLISSGLGYSGGDLGCQPDCTAYDETGCIA